MNILVVSIHEDSTLLAGIKVSKKSMVVTAAETTRTIFPALKRGNIESVVSVIDTARKKMKCKYQNLYVLLPNQAFSANTWPGAALQLENPQWAVELEKYAERRFSDEVSANESQLVRSVMIRPRTGGVFHGAICSPAIYCSTLDKVAAKLRLTLVCVEPESFGIIRTCGQKQISIVDIATDQAHVLVYHAEKGILSFILSLPETDNEKELAREWTYLLRAVDYAAAEFYPSGSQALNIYAPVSFLKDDGSRRRITPGHLQLGTVKSDPNLVIDLTNYLPLAAAVKERTDYFRRQVVVPKAPLATNLLMSAAVLVDPKEMVQKKIEWLFRGIAAFLVVGILYSAGMIGYYRVTNKARISDELQRKYDLAQAETATLERKIKTISYASKADGEVVKLIDTLVSFRPQGVVLNRIDVTENGYFEIEGFSASPDVFNLYVDALQQQRQLISNVYLERISLAAANNNMDKMKTFLIKGTAYRSKG